MKMLDQVFCRSTGPVDRCAQTCTTLFGWRADRPTRSIARELCYLDLALVDWAVERQSASTLCIQATVNRPVDRWHNSQKSDRWPVDRQQHQLLSWPPTAIFWEPINWASLGLFLQDFKSAFKTVLPTLLSVYLHLF